MIDLGGRTMIVLSCSNICKSFGIDLILDGVTFGINEGEKVGLVGVNGAGKSTLFNVLTNQLSYDSGELFISKSTTIGYLKQDTGLNEKLTITDECIKVFDYLIQMEKDLRNLELEISSLSDKKTESYKLDEAMHRYSALLDEFEEKNGYGFRSEIRGVLKGLGFCEKEFDQPIYQLSGGQKTRVSLAKLLLTKPDLLLLDEPTNYLDIGAVEWLEAFLKTYDGSILLISHDRYFLDEVVGRILEIEDKRLISYSCNYTNFIKQKAIIKDQELKDYIGQQKEISRQKDMIRRLAQHGTEKLAKRAKSKEKALEKVEELNRPNLHRHRVSINLKSQIESGTDVLSVQNVSKAFDDNRLFKNVSFDIYKGDKVGLIGPNGIGKSTLFKIIIDDLSKDTGDIILGHNVFIGYYAQELENLTHNKSVINEIWDENVNLNETEVRTILASFLFKNDDVFKRVGSLSGGEKAKLSMLKLILSKFNLLLLDEPTNHLDIDSKEVLEDALINYDSTVFTISHDRYFLNRIANKIIELGPDGCEVFLGNYDYYIQKKKEKLLLDQPAQRVEKTKTQVQEEKRKEREERAALKAKAKKQEDIETSISDLEGQIEDLQSMMCEEEVYSDEDKSREIHQKCQALEDQLEILYGKWEEIIICGGV